MSKLFDEALAELATVRDLIRWGVSRFHETQLFFGHGYDSAWDEAVTLVLSALHLPVSTDPRVLESRLTFSERLRVLDFLRQRIVDRIPAGYLTQEAWFAGLSFYVDRRVLIPRSPIAELIEQHFQPWIAEEQVQHILDLCTGSGCIAIACASYFPEAVVDAVDISAAALDVAAINVKRHQQDAQVNLVQGDLFKTLAPQKYDIIVSNPPYVDASDMAELPAEYLHEPQLGLAGGVQGLDIVIKILQQSANYLQPQGILIVEVGNSEAALIDLFAQVPFTWLEFERSEQGGVFLLTAAQLHEHQADFDAAYYSLKQ